MAFFRQMASQYGFDESEYLAAIRAIPVVSKARMESLMDCVVEMTQMLAANGLARLRQTRLEQDLRNIVNILKNSSKKETKKLKPYMRIFISFFS
jgi:hypothetical protein